MNFLKTNLLVLLAMFCSWGAPAQCPAHGDNSMPSNTPVRRNGWLHVDGRFLMNSSGEKVALHGPSFGWHNMWPQYYNETVVTYMAQQWNANIVRCSIGLDLDDQCFNKNPAFGYALVDSVVSGAIKNGIYVIVDFHSHANNLPLAKEFFSTITQKYGECPNVIYEIWNEPTEVRWSECKQYALDLIPVIREHAPKSIVIVPTPRWDQNVDEAADDPILGIDNLVYSLHFYAGMHQQQHRDKALYAINKGLPLFFAETGAMMHTGDGDLFPDSWEAWLQLAHENSISWITWSISDKAETCSMLVSGTPADARLWTDTNLKPWARMARESIMRANR